MGDEQRWEIYNGTAVAMSPAPTWGHQRFIGRLYLQLAAFLENKACEAFLSPFDVRLNADTKDDIVLQPDLVVICDHSKLVATGCVGAPDMVIEITSPSTARRDRTVKFDLYLKAGVREYWIVDSDTKTISVNILKNNAYVTSVYTETDTVPVYILKDCMIDLSKVFREDNTAVM
jgi:Uma2 family endonuclease